MDLIKVGTNFLDDFSTENYEKTCKTNDKKSESLQTEGRHFRSMICKINDV